ncbi:MAG: hypothetical protein LAE24_00065 [Candidatus Contendobacter sp.]|nr:hypothetical protein [Candidatus Contendobacter sp.]
MSMTETQPWDVVAYLDTESAMMAYLEAALEDGDPGVIAAALSDIARAKGLTTLAQEMEPDHHRPSPAVPKILELVTVLNAVRTLGLRLRVQTAMAAKNEDSCALPLANSLMPT